MRDGTKAVQAIIVVTSAPRRRHLCSVLWESCPVSRRDHFLTLRSARPLILPSLLSADFGNLEREVRSLEQAGARGLHLDVMDGCFVPNLTFGLPILAALRRLTTMPLDVHLMICEPQRYIERFFEAGADCLTVHIEAVERPREVLQQIRDAGAARRDRSESGHRRRDARGLPGPV